MQSVPLEEVVRNWLCREQRKSCRRVFVDGTNRDWELVGALLCRCSFQAAILWRYRISWYRTRLDRAAFRRLRVIEGPADESWRALSPDGTIFGAAARIEAEELTGTFEDIDVEYIRRRAASFDPASDLERLVLFRRDPGDAPYVVDGNHYATARALSLLDCAEFVSQPAYLGVRDDASTHHDEVPTRDGRASSRESR